MGTMYFDSQPIPEVEEFVKKHYKGGTVLDLGCGCGRYAHLFPDDEYVGVDGHEGNIKAAMSIHPYKLFLLEDLEDWKPDKKYDYLFSSVTLDQLENLPMGWAKTYILIEGSQYADIYNPQINEPLSCTNGVRKMVCEQYS